MGMKVKTQDLIGPALDWAVAKCEGYEVAVNDGLLVVIRRHNVVDYFDPSINWGWGGPIIEREQLTINYYGFDNPPYWSAQSLHLHYPKQFGCVGPTMLIAAMRCYVASKLGDEVDVPEELL